MKKIMLFLFLGCSFSWAKQDLSLYRNIPQSAQINFQLLPLLNGSIKKSEDPYLIESQIDNRKKIVPAITELKGSKEKSLYAEGSGSRGGGSGVLTKSGDSVKVQLLDVLRSENPERYPLFYKIDPLFYKISMNAEPDKAAEEIYTEVMRRVALNFRMLHKLIRATEERMPLNKWTTSISELPLMGDYIGDVNLNENQKHIQIAYRHADQIIYDQEMYKQMDGLNRAALRLHEYTYASSGLKDSVQVQRLVTLLMSANMVDATFSQSAVQIFFDMKLIAMVMDGLPLPEEAQLTDRKPSWPDVCGPLKSLKMSPDQSAIITIDVDPKEKYLTLNDLNRILNFSKGADIRLNPMEAKKFIAVLYLTKSLLSTKYPIFLYPAQSLPVDIICANSLTGQLNGLESGISFHREKNALQMATAAAEAAYFQAQKNLVLNPSVETQSAFSNAEQNLQELGTRSVAPSTGADVINGGSLLETMRIKFKF